MPRFNVKKPFVHNKEIVTPKHKTIELTNKEAAMHLHRGFIESPKTKASAGKNQTAVKNQVADKENGNDGDET